MTIQRCKFLRRVPRKQRNWTGLVALATFVAALIALYVALLPGFTFVGQFLVLLFG